MSAVAGRFMTAGLARNLLGIALVMGVVALAAMIYDGLDTFWLSAGKPERKSLLIRRAAAMLAACGGLLWGLSLLIGCYEPGLTPKYKPSRLVQSADGRVAIALADGWEQANASQDALLCAEDAHAVLSVLRAPRTRESESYLTIHAEQIAQSMAKGWSSVKWRHARLQSVGGMPAAWIELLGESPHLGIRNRMLLVLVDAPQGRYQYRFIAPEAKWEAMRQPGVDMAHTLRFR